MIKIVVVGASGKMGQTICQGILDEKDMELVGAVSLQEVGRDIGELVGFGLRGVEIVDSLDKVTHRATQVLIDFSHHSAVDRSVGWAVERGVHVIVGTTGLSQDQLRRYQELGQSSQSNIFIAPNFAIGAVLMVKLSQLASRYFEDCEIIELHHDQKADSPSGTSLHTAELLQGVKEKEGRTAQHEVEKVACSRGALYHNVHIHSIRLPGLVAHQEVIFGTKGQTLTIRHDSMDRGCYLPGIFMAVRSIHNLRGFTYGLERLLDIG
jgi:4-hydroxy-tetrahydrodipicolinate reductase